MKKHFSPKTCDNCQHLTKYYRKEPVYRMVREYAQNRHLVQGGILGWILLCKQCLKEKWNIDIRRTDVFLGDTLTRTMPKDVRYIKVYQMEINIKQIE